MLRDHGFLGGDVRGRSGEGLTGAAVPADVALMAAYMRNQFAFLGVKAPGQKAVTRRAVGSGAKNVRPGA